ncbi:EamA family transporter [Leifsonia sp. YIM 134122]|uniref:EamA family transporter n=1 Tax=Leifsonia stereocauli TaxID=3134136 RepID=A0ABU9W1S8_9MICO
MSSLALVLVLAAAVCHSAWNILAHGVSRIGLPFLWWGALASAVIWLPLVPITGGIGSGGVGGFVLGVVVSAVLHCVYMLVLQRGYSTGMLSTVYATARGTGPLVTVVVAVLVLGERPSGWALVGIAAILGGVVAIGLLDRPVADQRVGARIPVRRHRLDPAVAWGIATGVAIAAYTLWDANVVRAWDVSPVAFMVGCTAGEIVLFSALLGRRARELGAVWRAHWVRILIFGLLSPLSYILVLFAVTLAPVALVAPMREVSVVIVSAFGALVLREGRGGWRVAASVIVVAGVVLIGA